MTYNINFYCASGGVSPGEAVDLLVDSFSSQGLPVFIDDRAYGEGWASISLGSTESVAVAGDTRIEFHSNPAIVQSSVSQVAAEDNFGRIKGVDSLLILTLSGGGIDLPVVRALWGSVTSLWNAVPYDDVSGFDATEEMLG